MRTRDPNPDSLLAVYRELARAARTLHTELWKIEFAELLKRKPLLDASAAVEQLLASASRLDEALTANETADGESDPSPARKGAPAQGAADVSSFSPADLELRIRGTTMFLMRREINPEGAALGSGAFLGRLWRVLGKPNLDDFAGFGYLVHDAESDLVFAALFADTGLSYQGRIQDADFLPDVLRRFETELATVEPIDCEYTYRSMSGTWRCGIRGGLPFREKA